MTTNANRYTDDELPGVIEELKQICERIGECKGLLDSSISMCLYNSDESEDIDTAMQKLPRLLVTFEAMAVENAALKSQRVIHLPRDSD